MKTRRRNIAGFIAVLAAIILLIFGILTYIDKNCFGYPRTVSRLEEKNRSAIVDTATAWLGSHEANGSHEPIIDIYNSHTPLARGYAVQYDDEWCSTFASAVAIQCQMTDIIPTECGCERHIELFMQMDAWEENDNYVPLPGDYIFYSKDTPWIDENTGWAEHIGIVTGVWNDWIKVIEGNKEEAVKYRYIHVGDWRIRGYGIPDYASLSD